MNLIRRGVALTVAVALAALVTLIVGACGGATKATGTNGLEKKSPADVLQAAAAALAAAKSVHVVAVGRTGRIDVRIQHGSATGTLTKAGHQVTVTIIGGTGYVKSDRAGLEMFGAPPSAQRHDAGRWLKLPATATFTGFTLASLASQLTAYHGLLEPQVRQATLDGTKVVVISWRDGSKLDVANTGPAYPLRAGLKGGPSAGLIGFSQYGTHFHITPPSGAISLSNAASSPPTAASSLRFPARLFGINVNTGRAAQATIHTLMAALATQRSVFRSPQAAIYGTAGRGPSHRPGIMLFGARLSSALAQSANLAFDKRIAGYFAKTTGITTVRSFPAGPLGGALYCGHGIQSGVPGFACGWADKVAAGTVLYLSGVASSLSDAASKTNQVRALIEP